MKEKKKTLPAKAKKLVRTVKFGTSAVNVTKKYIVPGAVLGLTVLACWLSDDSGKAAREAKKQAVSGASDV